MTEMAAARSALASTVMCRQRAAGVVASARNTLRFIKSPLTSHTANALSAGAAVTAIAKSPAESLSRPNPRFGNFFLPTLRGRR
jgi:hypothetical protein